MKNYTDLTILLDRSGSMSSIKESMETALNDLIREHKAVPSTKVTLVQFDSRGDQDVVFQCVPVGSVESIKITPRGDTPLVDAFVKAIDRTGSRLSNMHESDRPDQVLFIVITDGAENASRTYRRSDVSLRVNKQTENYKWRFVYLGANQDAIGEARSYGINKDFAFFYQPNLESLRSTSRSLGINTVSYTANSSQNRGELKSFTPSQRDEAITNTQSTSN